MSQVPFTSINFGRNTSPEGRMITRYLLEASIDGIGKKHTTPIFPISIFQYKKGVNDKESTPNYDLKKLALKSLSKRIYPNIVNCDWSQNEEDPDDIDTYMATMGCVDGNELITYKIDGKLYIESFSDAYTRIWEMKPKSSSNEWGIELLLQDNNIEILDSSIKGFTKVKRMIKRYTNNRWLFISLFNEKNILLTTDHPLPTVDGRRVSADELNIGDELILVDTEYFKSTNLEDLDPSSVNTGVVKVKEITKFDKLIQEAYDVETESGRFNFSCINSYNCRTLLGKDRHGMGYKKVGRGNVCPVTMNLPKIGIKHGICLHEREKADLDGFWEELDEVLKLTEMALVDRFYHIAKQNVKSGFFMYENGTIADYEKANFKGIYEAMKHGTLAMGYIGIAEMCQALFGKDHSEDKEVHKFALEVVKHISEYAKECSERHDLNFSVYATPAESLCKTYALALQKEFGKIPKITDRDYITNSHHVPVWQKVSIYQKLEIEAPFCKYPTGGCITYIELESKIMKNLQAIEDIIDYAMDLDIPYLALNFPTDTCLKCGYSDEIEYNCPICGSTDIQRLRRVTGYLTTDYRNFNQGKIKEVLDRVKHSKYTSFGEKQ